MSVLHYFIHFLVFLNLFIIFPIIKNIKAQEIKRNVIREFPDKPIQLVKPDAEHKRLVIVEENVKLLHQILGPVATVAVVGKFHSGKSFLMNQLMRKSNGFGVGPSVQPKTMGIWMWGKPVQYVLKSGLKASIIFLDTEGFAANNVSENYDAKIFAVATLLSSHLLYNSVKIIDQADIDYLELLARRTQLFALRSQMSRAKWTYEFNKDLLSFPPLIWVVQDFVQDTEGETTKQWLHRLMDTHTRENELYEISLMDIFKSVDCHTLFLPAVRRDLLTDLSLATENDLTDEYKQERDELIFKLKNEIVPKEKNDKPVIGMQLAMLLEILVKAANDGSLADIPNRWDSFVNKLQTTATADCLTFYKADMDVLLDEEYKNEPVNEDIFQDWHKQSYNRSIELLKQLLHGLDEPLQKGVKTLDFNIKNLYERNKDINEKKIKLKCTKLQNQLEIKAEELLRKIELPIQTFVLIENIKKIENLLLEEFSMKVEKLIKPDIIESYLEALGKSIKNQAATIQLENNKAIESFFEIQSNQAMEKYITLTSSDYSRLTPRKPKILEGILKEGMIIVVEFFEKNCQEFKLENIYNNQVLALKQKLYEKAQQIKKENQEIANKHIKIEVPKLIQSFTERTSSTHLSLPVNDSELESRLKSEATKVVSDFKEMFQDFQNDEFYGENLKNLKENITQIADQRKQENIRAFRQEVSGPLERAKDIVLLAADKYSTVFSVKQFIRSVCLVQLNEGKPKQWSDKLKNNIINQFMDENEDLRTTINSKSGLWSSIVGFFQWLLWYFNFS